jgi:hypothetical protein
MRARGAWEEASSHGHYVTDCPRLANKEMTPVATDMIMVYIGCRAMCCEFMVWNGKFIPQPHPMLLCEGPSCVVQVRVSAEIPLDAPCCMMPLAMMHDAPCNDA